MIGLFNGYPIVGSVWMRNSFDYHGQGPNPVRPGETVTVNKAEPPNRWGAVIVRCRRDKNGSRMWTNLESFLERYACSNDSMPWIGEGI